MNPPQKQIPVPKPVQVPKSRNGDDDAPLTKIAAAAAAAMLLVLLLLLFLIKPEQGTGAADAGTGSGAGETTAAGTESNGNSDNNGTDSQDANSAADGQEKTSADSPKEAANADKEGTEAESESTEKSEQTQQASEKDTDENKKSDIPSVSTSPLKDKLIGGGKGNEKEPKEPETGGGTGDALSKGDAVVSFFGAKGKGAKFVYVIDHSGSMSGTPIEEAKKEMLKGLNILQSHHWFNIIFYDHSYIVWQPEKKLVAGTDKAKEDAKQFVKRVGPEGGTNPVPAIAEAFRCEPQVLFFLTDGEFSMNLDEVVKAAKNIHINVIEFGSGPESDTSTSRMLKELARRTNGDYIYKDVGSLDSL